MSDHPCPTCGQVFKQKGSLTRHLRRKTPCVAAAGAGAGASTDAEEAIIPPSSTSDEHPIRSSTKPLLKWVGGKTQILEEVLSRFPTEMCNYHEPFIGGGSVLLALLTLRQSGALRITGTVYASDLNAHLIRFYKTVQADPEGLLGEMRRLLAELEESTGEVVNRAPTTLEEAKTSPESYYYWCRAQFNALAKETNGKGVEADATMAALFLFLNKRRYCAKLRLANRRLGSSQKTNTHNEWILHLKSGLL